MGTKTDEKFILEDTGEGPVYLRFPGHGGQVDRTVVLKDRLPYDGRSVYLDFDAEGKLIGLEVT